MLNILNCGSDIRRLYYFEKCGTISTYRGSDRRFKVSSRTCRVLMARSNVVINETELYVAIGVVAFVGRFKRGVGDAIAASRRYIHL